MTDQIYPPKRPNMAHFESSGKQKAQADRKAQIGSLPDDYRNRHVPRPHPEQKPRP